MNDTTNSTPNVITPTRRLNVKEKTVFNRITNDFGHLVPSDAEQLTQFSETQVRYEIALKATKKQPTVTVPVVNRSTGNITGHKVVRNPEFATMKESAALLVSLGRRLMIDAHSAEKRQRLLTKKARSFAASQSKTAKDAATLNAVTEEQIEERMLEEAKGYDKATPEALRQSAIWFLTVFLPQERAAQNDPDLAYLYVDVDQ